MDHGGLSVIFWRFSLNLQRSPSSLTIPGRKISGSPSGPAGTALSSGGQGLGLGRSDSCGADLFALPSVFCFPKQELCLPEDYGTLSERVTSFHWVCLPVLAVLDALSQGGSLV